MERLQPATTAAIFPAFRGHNMTNNLLRQRRNLLITSIGLLLFDFAHMSVVKVSILGTELLVGDPIILKAFAWGMWAYFLLRYYQYRNAEGDHGIAQTVHAIFRARAIEHVLQVTGRKSLFGEVLIAKDGIGWSYSIKEHGALPNGTLGEPSEKEKGSLPLIRSLWWKLRAYLATAVHTPKITDHFLPFALAIATPLVIAGRAML